MSAPFAARTRGAHGTCIPPGLLRDLIVTLEDVFAVSWPGFAGEELAAGIALRSLARRIQRCSGVMVGNGMREPS
jgi:hypothetical protein